MPQQTRQQGKISMALVSRTIEHTKEKRATAEAAARFCYLQPAD
jgi:hypothetical protein